MRCGWCNKEIELFPTIEMLTRGNICMCAPIKVCTEQEKKDLWETPNE